MSTHQKLSHRYHNDNAFRTLVDLLYSMIQTHGFTPSEMREALFLAHYKFEMDNPATTLTIEKERMNQFMEMYVRDLK